MARWKSPRRPSAPATSASCIPRRRGAGQQQHDRAKRHWLACIQGRHGQTTSLTPDGIGPDIVLVRNNATGGVARSGGVLELSDTTVVSNTGVGLLADSGSAIHFFNSVNGNNNFVSNNVEIGVPEGA